MPAEAPALDETNLYYGNKMILGAEEFVHVKEAGATFAARIDSGANYSSLSATNIRHFERDGKKHVSFDIEANDKKFSVVAPLVKTDTIRQVASATAQARPIVRLTVKVGAFWVKTVFSLADRRRMQYPLLIGRTFLAEHGIVDVSCSFVQGTPATSGEVIVQRDVYLKSKLPKGMPASIPAAQAPEQETEARIAYPVDRVESGAANRQGKP